MMEEAERAHMNRMAFASAKRREEERRERELKKDEADKNKAFADELNDNRKALYEREMEWHRQDAKKEGAMVIPVAQESVIGKVFLPRSPGDQDESPYSPAMYDPKKHRDALRTKIGAHCPEHPQYARISNLPDSAVDGIAAAFQEFQLEKVRESLEAGIGLEAFFPPGTRIQIPKAIRVRIEQIVLMLGDAFVEKLEKDV